MHRHLFLSLPCQSNGVRCKIQISQETADLLKGHGKESWIKPREDKINAKGKGQLPTWWLLPKNNAALSSNASRSSAGSKNSFGPGDAAPNMVAIRRTSIGVNSTLSDRKRKLVDWNVEVLVKMLKGVVAGRNGSKSVDEQSLEFLEVNLTESSSLLKEVKETIALNGQFTKKENAKKNKLNNPFTKKEESAMNPEDVQLSREVLSQLHGMYNFFQAVVLKLPCYENSQFFVFLLLSSHNT